MERFKYLYVKFLTEVYNGKVDEACGHNHELIDNFMALEKLGFSANTTFDEFHMVKGYILRALYHLLSLTNDEDRKKHINFIKKMNMFANDSFELSLVLISALVLTSPSNIKNGRNKRSLPLKNPFLNYTTKQIKY